MGTCTGMDAFVVSTVTLNTTRKVKHVINMQAGLGVTPL